jgi:hypothetical protein
VVDTGTVATNNSGSAEKWTPEMISEFFKVLFCTTVCGGLFFTVLVCTA